MIARGSHLLRWCRHPCSQSLPFRGPSPLATRHLLAPCVTQKRRSFLSAFPVHVCPEPVLAKSHFDIQSGRTKTPLVFLPDRGRGPEDLKRLWCAVAAGRCRQALLVQHPLAAVALVANDGVLSAKAGASRHAGAFVHPVLGPVHNIRTRLNHTAGRCIHVALCLGVSRACLGKSTDKKQLIALGKVRNIGERGVCVFLLGYLPCTSSTYSSMI